MTRSNKTMEAKLHEVNAITALEDNYIWAIVHPNIQQCVVVDPGEATPVIDYLQDRELQLKAILITHHHWDHTGGIEQLLEQYPDIQVYGPANESIPGMTTFLSNGDVIELPEIGLHLETLDIPGHTLGHIAFYGHGNVFCGDTLFTAGCGKIFEGTTEQMYQSLQKIAALPEETLIYCGHEYTQQNLRFAQVVEPSNQEITKRAADVDRIRRQNQATVPAPLLLEKLTNPFLRTGEQAVKNAAEEYIGHTLSSEVEILKTLREWKNRNY